MIRMFLRWMRSLYFALFFLATVLAVCIWFFGPFVGGEEWRPFDSMRARIIWICSTYTFFFLLALLIFFLRRRKAKKMEAEMSGANEEVVEEEDLIGEEGKGWIAEINAEGLQYVAENDLGEPCSTSPAFQAGRIYLRGEKHLFCISDMKN